MTTDEQHLDAMLTTLKEEAPGFYTPVVALVADLREQATLIESQAARIEALEADKERLAGQLLLAVLRAAEGETDG